MPFGYFAKVFFPQNDLLDADKCLYIAGAAYLARRTVSIVMAFCLLIDMEEYFHFYAFDGLLVCWLLPV